MAKTALARFTDDYRAELAGTYARLFADAFPDDIEDERNRTARVRKIATWAIGFFQLLAEFLNEQHDNRVFEYQKTLIQSGDLSVLDVPDLVKSCMLVNRTFRAVWQDVPGPGPTDDASEKIRQVVELLIVSAAGFYDEKLKMNEKFVDQLFDGADLIFVMLDTGGRILRVNDLVTSTWGRPREEMLGRGFVTFVHDDDLQLVTRSVGLVLAGTPRIFEMRIRTAGEQIRILHVFLTPMSETGQIVGMRLVAQDVTKQKTLQDALRRSEEKFHALLEHSPSPILIVKTEDGSLVDINRRGADVVGIEKEQARNMSLLDIFEKDAGRDVVELLQAAIHFGTSEKTALGLRSGHDDWRRVNVSASAIEFGADRVVQLVLTEAPIEDDESSVPDIRESAREIQRLRDDAVRAALDLALSRLERDTRHWLHTQFRAGGADVEETGGARVLQALDNMERFEFRRRGTEGLVDLAGALENLVALLRDVYGRRIVFHLKLGELFHVADHNDRVLPAVTAVILAAVESTKGGDITIRAETNGGLNIIQVMDNGEEIPQETVDLARSAGDPLAAGRRPWDLYRDALCAMENAGGGLQIRSDRLGGARVTLTIPGARWDEVSEPAPHTLIVVPDPKEPESAIEDIKNS